MPSVYDTLYEWARKTTTSFADLRFVSSQRDEVDSGLGDGLIYRLKHWPELPRTSRTADVFRTLSVMSDRPVDRHWILANSKLRAHEVDRLLERLVAEDAVEVIEIVFLLSILRCYFKLLEHRIAKSSRSWPRRRIPGARA